MKRLLSICVLFLLGSCQKDELLLQKKAFVTNDPILVGNRLAFTSKAHLTFFVNDSKTKDLSELKAKISKFETAGFRSLLPTFESTNLQRVE